MPTGQYRHPLFGLIEFEVAAWSYGAPITRFIRGFDPASVTDLLIPQLRNVPGTNGGVMKFHERAHQQVLQVFADLEAQNLLGFVHASAGSFFPRLKKPASLKVSHEPSNHSFGIAIDINSAELPLNTNDNGSVPGTVKPLASTFEALGFRWGQSFGDPMHFEVVRFIDTPRTTVHAVNITRNGAPVAVGAKELRGRTYVKARDFTSIFGGVITEFLEGPPPRIKVQPPTGVLFSMPVEMIASSSFVLLTELAARYNMAVSWDNATKTAALS